MFGPHVNRYHASGARPPMGAHVAAAIAEAAAEGFRVDSVAFYISEPRSLTLNLHSDERPALRSLLQELAGGAYVHSAYRAWPWGGSPATAAFIREELKVCAEIGARGLVVHLPKAPIETVMKYAHTLLEPTAKGVRIYFENPAVVPKESYYDSPVKLAKLVAALRVLDPNMERFGLCVDTSHLWVNGNDLQSYQAAKSWFDGLVAACPSHCVMLHLNDSVTPRGHGPDEHAALTHGRIWSGYKSSVAQSGLAAVVDYAVSYEIPTILERKPKEMLRNDYRILAGLSSQSSITAPKPARKHEHEFKRGGEFSPGDSELATKTGELAIKAESAISDNLAALGGDMDGFAEVIDEALGETATMADCGCGHE